MHCTVAAYVHFVVVVVDCACGEWVSLKVAECANFLLAVCKHVTFIGFLGSGGLRAQGRVLGRSLVGVVWWTGRAGGSLPSLSGLIWQRISSTSVFKTAWDFVASVSTALNQLTVCVCHVTERTSSLAVICSSWAHIACQLTVWVCAISLVKSCVKTI